MKTIDDYHGALDEESENWIRELVKSIGLRMVAAYPLSADRGSGRTRAFPDISVADIVERKKEVILPKLAAMFCDENDLAWLAKQFERGKGIAFCGVAPDGTLRVSVPLRVLLNREEILRIETREVEVVRYVERVKYLDAPQAPSSQRSVRARGVAAPRALPKKKPKLLPAAKKKRK